MNKAIIIIIIINTLLLMRKILKNEVATSISEQFQISVNDQYNLRGNFAMLKLAKSRTNELKRSFSYCTIVLKLGIICQLN
jgi:hypothetical protein